MPLVVRGAAEHNLADVDVALASGQWIVVTGPSGSGKTSLVFGTLVAESQRRYLSTLSARARHYLTKMGRPTVASIVGLPVSVAVGQSTVRGNARSTVGTLSGVADLLRLWFAREAVDPEGVELTRSHFSFNHPRGACERCDGLGVTDRVDPALLVANPARSIREGAIVTTLKSGYTVYSQVTLEVMNQICEAHGFDVDTPWNALTEAQRDVVFYGTDALEVPFGKHGIESRMRWKGITAKPRKTGHYRGIVRVIEEILRRDRNPGVLRFVRSATCEACGGTRLARPGREAHIGGRTLANLSSSSLLELERSLVGRPASPVWDALRPSVLDRLERLRRLSLGHLTLDRVSTGLSGGEAQRLRLAAQLTSGLSGLAVCLDEPTLGLHPEAGPAMAAVLDEVVAGGNTLIVVEHDPEMVRHGDHQVAVGPGAGPDGGRIIFEGQPPADPLGPPPSPKPADQRRAGDGEIILRGASLHNLEGATLRIRTAAFNVVVGPSGAGKSSLVFQTLLPALQGREGGPYTSLEGATPGRVRALDARPPGKTARSTPATFSGIFELIRERFAATPEAARAGLSASHFSYNNAERRCPTCDGLGVQRIGLHLVADARVTCPTCQGSRYASSLLEAKVGGKSIADVLGMSVAEVRRHFADDPPIASLAAAMEALGLGYLALGQPSASLSRGEAQRLKLATLLGRTEGAGRTTQSLEPSLLVLDEPDRGLAPEDIQRLLGGFERLVDAGHTILAISHQRQVWAAADHIVEVRQGRTSEHPSITWGRLVPPRTPRPRTTGPDHVRLRGVTHHNLRGVDVDIPHDAITVVAGVSGSGKSSLVFDALAGEAWRRFGESLPFSARRFLRRLPRAPMRSAEGLRSVVMLAQGQPRAPRRSTVATQSELGPLLRTLWSRAGTPLAQGVALTAEHFSPDRPLGACSTCDGLGVVGRCDPDRLVTHPERSLSDGAMKGTKPGKFFTEPGDRHLATLRAAMPEADFDQPWTELPEQARHVALHGTGDRVHTVKWDFVRGKRRGEHRFEGTWDGFCALVEAEARRRGGHKHAAAWAAPLVDRTCPACEGARLGPSSRDVRLGDRTLPELLGAPLRDAHEWLAALEVTDPARRVAVDSLRPAIAEILTALDSLGLGHLSLERGSATLSAGERQRVRLVGVLGSGLTQTMIVLDEPARGLHAAQIDALLERLRSLCDLGNTVIVVSHRPELIRAADHLIELGPGAAAAGGTVVSEGVPDEVLAADGPTARALRSATVRRRQGVSDGRIHVLGAHAHNLCGIDLELPASGLVAVTGVSGSGKSSLVFDVLEPSARTGSPQACASVEGFEHFVEVCASRGQQSASTPAHALGAMQGVQKLFAAEAASQGIDVPRAAFSFASPAGRCETCRGTGREEVAMDVLADLSLPCPACAGRRFRPEVLAVRWKEFDVAAFFQTPVERLSGRVDGKLGRVVEAMMRTGLGHVALGRPARELSGGERQRLDLATVLLSKQGPTLVLLDEPAAGLHEADVARLVAVFHALADRGDLVIATEHRSSLIDAADWVVELGPGGGPDGGQLVFSRPQA